MTLDHAFKTMLFWIVSRGNNCIDCMGHQEAQLPAFGVAGDRSGDRGRAISLGSRREWDGVAALTARWK
jgi:hypothetical protein